MVLPKLICFDWDGTLINTHESIKNACIAAGEELMLPPVSLEKIDAMTGVQIDIFFNQVFGIEVDLETILPVYHKHYDLQPYAELYPEVIEMLNFIRERDIATAIVTNKSRKSLEKELKHFGIAHLFDSTWVAEEHAPKPSPLMLRLAQASHQVLPEESWMVGDALPDLYASERAGCDTTVLVSSITVPTWMEEVIQVGSLSYIQELIVKCRHSSA
jgi:phosphoglycolate phosphatase